LGPDDAALVKTIGDGTRDRFRNESKFPVLRDNDNVKIGAQIVTGRQFPKTAEAIST
jgi:hypothetical protein